VYKSIITVFLENKTISILYHMFSVSREQNYFLVCEYINTVIRVVQKYY